MRTPLLRNLKHPNPLLITSLPSPTHPSHHSYRFLSTAPSLITVRDIPSPHTGHIRILSLKSPHNRNAISRQLLSELSSEITAVRNQTEDEATQGEAVGHGTRVLTLASEIDECFCAGADLKERRGMSREETNQFLHSLRTTLATLSSLPIPTISAVSSIALGGGLELALATTLRVFASTAVIGLPETRLGIIPGAGGTYRLRHSIGEAKALELILTGRRVSGEEAYRLGICERLVETGGGNDAKRVTRGEVLDAAIGMAKEICEGGPGAVGAVLRAVRGGSAEAEGKEYEGVLGFEDRDEALRAFGEKRKAKFTGRRKGSG